MQVAQAMARGIENADPDANVDLCPISDGGDGFISSISHAFHHTQYVLRCHGPRGKQIEADWFLLHQKDDSQSAVIEMAAAAGLHLLTPDQRDPTKTTTYGVGELIAHAVEHGVRDILIGIGGSATNDGGCGMVQALGARFLDRDGKAIDTPITGSMLESIARIDASALREKLRGVTVTVACDVINPLTGPSGAAHVYAPQKGATPQQVKQLDRGLSHVAGLWRDQLGVDVEKTPGAGAAGGVGGGLIAFCHAALRPGVEIVLEQVHFDQRVKDCDLCLTGEGQLDGQTLAGKAVLGVAKAAAKHHVPTIALVGRLGPDHEKVIAAGLKDVIEIGEGLEPEESMAQSEVLIEQAAKRIVELFLQDERHS